MSSKPAVCRDGPNEENRILARHGARASSLRGARRIAGVGHQGPFRGRGEASGRIFWVKQNRRAAEGQRPRRAVASVQKSRRLSAGFRRGPGALLRRTARGDRDRRRSRAQRPDRLSDRDQGRTLDRGAASPWHPISASTSGWPHPPDPRRAAGAGRHRAGRRGRFGRGGPETDRSIEPRRRRVDADGRIRCS